MKQPLVSIISPIYGVEKYIGACLESLFTQTYPIIEYVFVNDRTPDNSMSILHQMIEKYSIKDVTIINHKTNMGLCGVRNSGAKAAKGEYILFVDSDDLLPQDSVEMLVECALTNNADYVESDFAFYPGHVGDIYKRTPPADKNDYLASYISMKSVVSVWGKLYKRSLFSDIDDLFVIGKDNIDDVLSTPILINRAKKLAYTDKVTYYYRIDNAQSYTRGHRFLKWNKVDDLIYCTERFKTLFGNSRSQAIQNALKEQKYQIKKLYYLKLKDKKDRYNLIHLFSEIEEYVETKPFIERICWKLMKYDMRTAYLVVSKVANRFLLCQVI